MRIDRLESEKRDDLRHLNDDELAVVTGGSKMVACGIPPPIPGYPQTYMTKQQCEAALDPPTFGGHGGF
jgi:hypothetical protein